LVAPTIIRVKSLSSYCLNLTILSKRKPIQQEQTAKLVAQ
jgi:hypothetical protein